jgi:hypothetical protein
MNKVLKFVNGRQLTMIGLTCIVLGYLGAVHPPHVLHEFDKVRMLAAAKAQRDLDHIDITERDINGKTVLEFHTFTDCVFDEKKDSDGVIVYTFTDKVTGNILTLRRRPTDSVTLTVWNDRWDPK